MTIDCPPVEHYVIFDITGVRLPTLPLRVYGKCPRKAFNKISDHRFMTRRVDLGGGRRIFVKIGDYRISAHRAPCYFRQQGVPPYGKKIVKNFVSRITTKSRLRPLNRPSWSRICDRRIFLTLPKGTCHRYVMLNFHLHFGLYFLTRVTYVTGISAVDHSSSWYKLP